MPLGFLLPWLVASVGCGQAPRKDEFLCEEAVAHLVDCCGELKRTIDCANWAADVADWDELWWLGGTVHHPDIDIYQSVCIRDSTCAVMQSAGMCERSESRTQPLRVCP